MQEALKNKFLRKPRIKRAFKPQNKSVTAEYSCKDYLECICFHCTKVKKQTEKAIKLKLPFITKQSAALLYGTKAQSERQKLRCGARRSGAICRKLKLADYSRAAHIRPAHEHECQKFLEYPQCNLVQCEVSETPTLEIVSFKNRKYFLPTLAKRSGFAKYMQ